MKEPRYMKSQSIQLAPGVRSRFASCIVVFLGCAALLGCSSTPPPATASGQPAMSSPVVSSESQVLPEKQVEAATSAANTTQAYILGPGDVISISVYSHPELSFPGQGSSGGLNGILVTNDGSVALPLIGNVTVGGMTMEQAQHTIAADYASYVVMPDITLQLVEAQSLRYYLLGSFTMPGVKYPGRTMTLLDALALGGSVDIANADLYQAYVAKGSVKIPVDLHALLVDGDLTENITLDSGTAIVIPPSTDENAYVFGAVGKPGAVPFHSGELSLLQALSVASLDLNNYTSAQLGRVHIIRAHGRSAEFLVVDGSKIINGEATSFELEPGDIVFVPPNNIASWNQVLSLLLPSLTAVSGALNPFVEIKYLSQKQD